MAQLVKNPPARLETQDSGLGVSPGEGNGNPLQYPCLENSMDRGALPSTVHRIAESDITEQLSMQACILIRRSGHVTVAMELKDTYSLEEKL